MELVERILYEFVKQFITTSFNYFLTVVKLVVCWCSCRSCGQFTMVVIVMLDCTWITITQVPGDML